MIREQLQHFYLKHLAGLIRGIRQQVFVTGCFNYPVSRYGNAGRQYNYRPGSGCNDVLTVGVK